MPPKLFLPEVSSAATRPVCRTSNAEIKIFDNIFLFVEKNSWAGNECTGYFFRIIPRSCGERKFESIDGEEALYPLPWIQLPQR